MWRSESPITDQTKVALPSLPPLSELAMTLPQITCLVIFGIAVGYPTATEEFVIVERMTGILQAVQEVLTTQQLIGLQQEADRVYVDPALIEYAVRMVTATRKPKDYGLKELEHYILFGSSP